MGSVCSIAKGKRSREEPAAPRPNTEGASGNQPHKETTTRRQPRKERAALVTDMSLTLSSLSRASTSPSESPKPNGAVDTGHLARPYLLQEAHTVSFSIIGELRLSSRSFPTPPVRTRVETQACDSREATWHRLWRPGSIPPAAQPPPEAARAVLTVLTGSPIAVPSAAHPKVSLGDYAHKHFSEPYLHTKLVAAEWPTMRKDVLAKGMEVSNRPQFSRPPSAGAHKAPP